MNIYQALEKYGLKNLLENQENWNPEFYKYQIRTLEELRLQILWDNPDCSLWCGFYYVPLARINSITYRIQPSEIYKIWDYMSDDFWGNLKLYFGVYADIKSLKQRYYERRDND